MRPEPQAEPVQPKMQSAPTESTRAAPAAAGADPTKSVPDAAEGASGEPESESRAAPPAAPTANRSATADAAASQHEVPQRQVPHLLLSSRQLVPSARKPQARPERVPASKVPEPQPRVQRRWAEPQASAQGVAEAARPLPLPASLQVLLRAPRCARNAGWRWPHAHGLLPQHHHRASSSGSSCPVRPTREAGRGSPSVSPLAPAPAR